MNDAEIEQIEQQEPQRREPPVAQLEDVPEEEWGYWSAQAWAGCGVILALMLAMFLPLTLAAVMDERLGKLIGFGVAATIALVSIGIISRLTYRKRHERREALREELVARGGAGQRPADPATHD